MRRERQILPHGKGLYGDIFIPGDKSISHRSVMFASLGDRAVTIKNFLHAQDCLSTVNCMRGLGISIEEVDDNTLIVQGRGMHGLTEPKDVIDAGNSGTTLRLMMGILAAQPFMTTFTGDASLKKRPLGRVIKPLKAMNAQMVARQDDKLLPLTIIPGNKLSGICYHMPMASAQVKSAILLAGLYSTGETTVIEPYISRDHTERMLAAFGVKVKRDGTAVTVTNTTELISPDEIIVPGDISSAAFWLVAASIMPGSKVVLRNVGINITRTGVIDVLQAMGASIEIFNECYSGGEKIADICVKHAKLHGTTIGAEMIPRLIDEIPILTVAAMFAKGSTEISGAGELRVKETDRLAAIAAEFNKFADCITENADGLIIAGGKEFRALPNCFSYHDHRIAMALAIAGVAGNGVVLAEPECVQISYPDFYTTLSNLQLATEVNNE